MSRKIAPTDAILRFCTGSFATFSRRRGSVQTVARIAACAVAFLLACPAQGIAQMVPLPGINFKLGDTVAAVKQALNTETEPEPMPKLSFLPAAFQDPNKGKTMLHLRTKGIWVFFDPAGLVDVIRLDPPFASDVKGVRLGVDEKALTEKLGPPLSKAATPGSVGTRTYQYVIDDTAYLKFDVSTDGVQRISITR